MIIIVLVGLGSFALKKYIDVLINQKIDKHFEKIANKAELKNEVLKEECKEEIFRKKTFFDFLPILNFLNSFDYFIHLDDVKKEITSKCEDLYPELYFEKIREEKKKIMSKEILKKKEYFIGKIIDGKPKNIFFAFDGYDFYIHEDSNYLYGLNDDVKGEILLKMLYLWYSGFDNIYNASLNIDEVYTECVVKWLNYLYCSDKEKQNEDTLLLKRKIK